MEIILFIYSHAIDDMNRCVLVYGNGRIDFYSFLFGVWHRVNDTTCPSGSRNRASDIDSFIFTTGQRRHDDKRKIIIICVTIVYYNIQQLQYTVLYSIPSRTRNLCDRNEKKKWAAFCPTILTMDCGMHTFLHQTFMIIMSRLLIVLAAMPSVMSNCGVHGTRNKWHNALEPLLCRR